ncbi:MAG: DMT family transporter [Acidobacteriaceae bacterium]|nr:DMT family transporter [Acidobacteriaceae bacterium]
MRRFAPHLALIAVTLIWGTTFSLVKLALRDASPLAFNLARMTLAFLVLATLNHRELKTVTPRQWAAGALAGLFLALGYQLQTAGLAYTTATKSAFLTGLVVVLVPLLCLIPGITPPGQKPPGIASLLGAAVAFCGLILLTTSPGSGFALLSGMHRGEWLSLACALIYAFHLLTLAHTAGGLSARLLGTLQIGFAALTMLLTLPLGGAPHLHLTGAVLLALAVTALLATAAAFTIQSWAQQHLPATHTALILTLEPIFAWLFALLFLKESLGHRALAGAGCILLGILLAELWPTNGQIGSILPTAER